MVVVVVVVVATLAGDEALELAAIEPDPPALAAHVDGHAFADALVERASFTAGAPHDTQLLRSMGEECAIG
jgi:hypothetical protein